MKLVAFSGRRPAFTVCSWHDHPFYELGLVLSGQCDWHLDQGRRQLKPGDAILLNPKTRHREETREGQVAQLAWMGFESGGAPPDWSHRVICTGADFAEVTGNLEILAREHHRPEHVSSPVRLGLAAQSLLLLIARQAERAGPRPTVPGQDLNPRQVHCVESAAHYFRANFSDSLSIAQVAAYYSLCPAHFTTLFRRRYGKSPRTYLRQARLERVAELLMTSDGGLKEIAAECGFVDDAHLCKAFKEAKGVTPRVYRLAGR